MNDKPKMVEVVGEDYREALRTRAELGTPMFILDGTRMYMLAEQFRAWKRSQSQSAAEQK